MMAAIALLVFIPAVESCLRLSSNTTTVNVTTGSDVLLNCHFVYKFKLTLGMISVSWRRQPATEESQQMIAHFDGLNLQTFYNNSFLSPKALLEGDASLLMKNVSNSDTGDYFCDVLVTPVKKEIQLNLNVAEKEHKKNKETRKPFRKYPYGIIGTVAGLGVAGALIYTAGLKKRFLKINKTFPKRPISSCMTKSCQIT